MTRKPACPRCGAELLGPSAFNSAWRCGLHGAVAPLHQHTTLTPETVEHVRARARVPMWLPDPLPAEWMVTGLAWAGDERAPSGRPGRAVAVALTGPAPLGGTADLILVAEEPGTGLGAGYAALDGPDPGDLPNGPPHATVRAAGHVTAMWLVSELPGMDGSEHCVYVGEAAGVWLWAVMWPASAGHLLAEEMLLTDLRDHVPAELPLGAPSHHLHPRGGPGRYGTSEP